MFVHWKMTDKTFVSLKKDLKNCMCLNCKMYIKYVRFGSLGKGALGAESKNHRFWLFGTL